MPFFSPSSLLPSSPPPSLLLRPSCCRYRDRGPLWSRRSWRSQSRMSSRGSSGGHGRKEVREAVCGGKAKGRNQRNKEGEGPDDDKCWCSKHSCQHSLIFLFPQGHRSQIQSPYRFREVSTKGLIVNNIFYFSHESVPCELRRKARQL